MRPGHVAALFGRAIVLIGQSVPLFWLGILLVLIFSVRLRWLPAAGNQRPFSLVLPAVTLGLYPMARIARTLRVSLQDALRQDYIITARSKGLAESTVILRHALRNAALPAITVVGLQFGTLLGGAIVTETIFAWPGIGLLSIQAVQARDLPLVRALIAVVAHPLHPGQPADRYRLCLAQPARETAMSELAPDEAETDPAFRSLAAGRAEAKKLGIAAGLRVVLFLFWPVVGPRRPAARTRRPQRAGACRRDAPPGLARRRQPGPSARHR